MRKEKLKKGVVATGLAVCIGLSSMPTITTIQGSVTVVEAKSKKKDKKKPVFKNFGKTKITVEKGKLIKIPKVKAKDNVDGDVTKKIQLKVVYKGNNKRIKDVEKKVRNGKAVKFDNEGEYDLEYKVKDKAGNVAKKTKKIIVEDSKKKTTEEPTTYVVDPTIEQPTTEQPTEEKTTEKVTTEEKTTEKPTIIKPTTEKPTTGIYQETVNGIKYNITRDYKFFNEKICEAPRESDKIKIIIENDYSNLYFGIDSGLTYDSQYLKFLGSIKATDENGKDISDNIIIEETAFLSTITSSGMCLINIYVEDDNSNSFRNVISLGFRDFDKYTYDDLDELELISLDPLAYGKPRVEVDNLSSSLEEVSMLKYRNED